jgi:hypothetical protein
MIKEAGIITAFVYLLVFGRLGWLWVKGTIDPKSATRALELFAALAIGTLTAGMIAKSVPPIGQGTGFACQKYSSVFYDCAGWPILGPWFGDLVTNMLAWFQAGAGLPAAAAPFLGNLYIAKKMSEGNLETSDILRAYLSGCFIFLVLTRLDLTIDFFNSVITEFSWLSARVEEGKDVMAKWSQNIDQYGSYSKDNLSWYNTDSWLLAIGLGILSLVVNLGSVLFASVQCLLLIFAPISFFKGILYDRADVFQGLRLVFSFSTLMLFNNIVWTVMSWFPKIKSPSQYGSEVILGDSAWSIMGSMLGAALIIGVFYILVGIVCYFIVKKAFGGES